MPRAVCAVGLASQLRRSRAQANAGRRTSGRCAEDCPLRATGSFCECRGRRWQGAAAHTAKRGDPRTGPPSGAVEGGSPGTAENSPAQAVDQNPEENAGAGRRATATKRSALYQVQCHSTNEGAGCGSAMSANERGLDPAPTLPDPEFSWPPNPRQDHPLGHQHRASPRKQRGKPTLATPTPVEWQPN